ncbi:hypothetical protein C7S18_00295 [Ahniella affigens]|uniref:DUF11 domain-containing protein n=1 Tax=Ahniella affigens TaxID=2021234 RepID=A0A2P1PLM6_9GAMM|nr:hypothetical protein [Ahniella affigens]AVP95726.1 hypothetical protein C7S18_00295 [Ahniella affigens]
MKKRMITWVIGLALSTNIASAAPGELATPPLLIDDLSGQTLLDSAIANNPAGDTVMIWLVEDPDTNLREIRYQRFDEHAEPIGAYDVVAGPLTGLSSPSVALGDTGTFWVVWQQDGADTDGTGIMARIWQADAQFLSEPFLVNQITTGDQQTPSISFDPDSYQVLVVWDSPAPGGGHAVMLREFNHWGTPTCPSCIETQVNALASPRLTTPQVVANNVWPSQVFWLAPSPDSPFDDRVHQMELLADFSPAWSEPEVWGRDLLIDGDVEHFDVARNPEGWYFNSVAYDIGEHAYVDDGPMWNVPVYLDAGYCDLRGNAVGRNSVNGLLLNCLYENQRIPFIGLSEQSTMLPIPVLADWLPPYQPGQIEAFDLAMDVDGNGLVPVQLPPSYGGSEPVLAVLRLRGQREVPMSLSVQAAESALAGSVITYAFQVRNLSTSWPQQVDNLKGLELNIELPEGAVPTDFHDYGWRCSGSALLTCRTLAPLRAGQIADISFDIEAPHVPGPLVVQAHLSSIVNSSPTEVTVTATTDIAPEDLSPNSFALPTLSPVALGTVYEAGVSVAGISAPVPIAITNGRYSIEGRPFTSEPGVVENGEWVNVQHTSASTYATTAVTVLTIGDKNASMTTTTGAEGTMPLPFQFVDATAVPPNTTVTSNPVSILGLTQASSISVQNGSYAINGGPFQTQPGMIAPDASVQVRHTSAHGFSNTVDTVLSIGGVSDTFSSTTQAIDSTPDAFWFAAQSNQVRGSLVTSNAIVPQGFNTPIPVQVQNGSYSINNGPFTTASGTIAPGNQIRVQHTAASSFQTSVLTTLTLGGISGSFISHSELRDDDPNLPVLPMRSDVPRNSLQTSSAFSITGINDVVSIGIVNGAYAINGGAYQTSAGTVRSGDTVQISHTSASGFAQQTASTLSVGSGTVSFVSQTEFADTTPDPYAFAALNNVPRSTEQTSNVVTVAGINTAAAISVTGGTYSINNGPFVSTSGAISVGDSVRVRHVSAASFSTAAIATLSIGGAIANFTSVTEAIDTTPSAFDPTDLNNVPIATLVSAAPIVVNGINAPTPISVSNGSFTINGGSAQTVAGTVNPGDTVIVRHVSAATFATATETVLTIGGISGLFRSTTEAADSIPSNFSFAAQTGLATNVAATSPTVTVTGINTASPISVTGGSYAINSGAFVTTAGTVNAGDQVRVRVTTAAAANTAVNATLTIGGVSANFTATTGSVDTTPNVFAFTDVVDARRGKSVTSASVTVNGINASVPITVSGAGVKYSKNGGTFTSNAGTVANGDQIRLQLTASANANTTVNAIATVGGISDTWSVTTGTR